ncbi:MAG: Imm50 family immunity protein [Terriglobales bacterium]
MAVPIEIEEIPGAAELHDWFGYWPDFHDAEIISLHLNRKGISSLRVHAWDTTKEVDEKGHYVMAKHIVVEFVLENVSELALNGFSQQNVISGLDIEKIGSGFRLTLGECYGLAGSIEAESVSIRINPGKPS